MHDVFSKAEQAMISQSLGILLSGGLMALPPAEPTNVPGPGQYNLINEDDGASLPHLRSLVCRTASFPSSKADRDISFSS
jgi:hypothetical protein